MPTTLSFTDNLARHLECPSADVDGATLQEAFEDYFRHHPRVRGYVLDDQGGVRKHVAIFINEQLVTDRHRLTDPLRDGDRIYVMQALSGG